jgi:predicted dehydrogenase
MSDRILRWGIMGTGNIARQFVQGLAGSTRTRAAVVGSRAITTAEAFATAHGVPVAVGSYDQLVDRPDVDAIYVSLPNSMHKEWTIKALRAGKHVLCEKPIAMNADEAREMFDVAGECGKVLVEAFMYQSHPLTHAVLKAVKEGAIGQVNVIRTSFCYRTKRVEGNIRFDRPLGGGALMDIGCYCIGLTRLIAGEEPSAMSAFGRKHSTGIDDRAMGMMGFPNGILATFTCAMDTQADNTAIIAGSEGWIEVPVPWKPPAENAIYTIARGTPPRMDTGGKVAGPWPRQTIEITAGKELYALEADDFAGTVLDDVPPAVSHEHSLGNMRVLDEMRRQVGVAF